MFDKTTRQWKSAIFDLKSFTWALSTRGASLCPYARVMIACMQSDPKIECWICSSEAIWKIWRCVCVCVCVWDRVEDTTSQAAAPQAPHIEQQQLVHNIEVYIFICSMVCKCWVLFFFTSSLPTNAFPSFDNFFLILSRATDCEFDYSFSFPTLFSLFFLFCHEVWSLLLLHRCAMSHLCTSRNTRMTFCLSFNSERK